MKKRKQNLDSDFELSGEGFFPSEDRLHIHGKKGNIICLTEGKGYSNPGNKNLTELVVDSSGGFIPLWDRNVILNWRFGSNFGKFFKNPNAAQKAFRQLLAESVLMWGDACPVKFSENHDEWDFEIVMSPDQCNSNGCVLATAFFPQTGRDSLTIYPKMFSQTRQEQLETLVHELGHIFGLRHFFAKVKETAWPSEVFEKHVPFTIMNYGENSYLTEQDVKDLKLLYRMVWEGRLTQINGTKIERFRPYHEHRSV